LKLSKTLSSTLLFFSLLTLIACTKEKDLNSQASDYLVFGHFYGMCWGEECVETYKLIPTALYEDSNDRYDAEEPFNFNRLSNEKFELVRDLTDYLPTELIEGTEDVYGCPDCADQGGLLVILSVDGAVRKWRIDNAKANIPVFLHEFTDKIKERIDLLK
jgi:hypothetical protein